MDLRVRPRPHARRRLPLRREADHGLPAPGGAVRGRRDPPGAAARGRARAGRIPRGPWAEVEEGGRRARLRGIPAALGRGRRGARAVGGRVPPSATRTSATGSRPARSPAGCARSGSTRRTSSRGRSARCRRAPPRPAGQRAPIGAREPREPGTGIRAAHRPVDHRPRRPALVPRHGRREPRPRLHGRPRGPGAARDAARRGRPRRVAERAPRSRVGARRPRPRRRAHAPAGDRRGRGGHRGRRGARAARRRRAQPLRGHARPAASARRRIPPGRPRARPASAGARVGGARRGGGVRGGIRADPPLLCR